MRSIILNGRSFPVRGNVHDILVSCSSFFGPQLLWIDTICIDQGNATEKNVQVRAMQDIYAHAAHILVCLGGDWSHPALSLVDELRILSDRRGPEYLRGHIAQFYERWRYDPYLRARVRALVAIMAHPWFRRVWVVQEVVVAKQVTFFYGNTPIGWERLYRWRETWCDGPVFSLLAGLASPSAGRDGVFGAAMPEFFGWQSFRYTVGHRGEYHDRLLGPNLLSHVLRAFGDKDATDPRDKVFALIGLAVDDGSLKSFIDYDRTTEEVMLGTAYYLLRSGDLLDVIDLAGLRQQGRMPGLASWAVDWTVTRSGLPLNFNFAPDDVQYHASGRKLSIVRLGSSKRDIFVDGEIFDRIKWLAPLPDATSQVSPAILALGSYPTEALSLAQTAGVPDPYPHWHREKQSLEEVVWRTLIGDKTLTEQPAPTSCGRSLKILTTFLRELQAEGRDVADLLSGPVSLKKRYQLLATPERQLEFQRAIKEYTQFEFLVDYGEGSMTFMFAVTETGYLAMVPDVSTVGDTICFVRRIWAQSASTFSSQGWRGDGGGACGEVG